MNVFKMQTEEQCRPVSVYFYSSLFVTQFEINIINKKPEVETIVSVVAFARLYFN